MERAWHHGMAWHGWMDGMAWYLICCALGVG